MADEIKVEPSGFPDVQKHNEEVARKLADQDAAGHSTVSPQADLDDTTSALDALAAAHDKKANEEKDDAAPVVEPPKAEPIKKDDAAPAPEPTAEEKAAAEAKAKSDEAQKKADEYFKDSPKLPPNASPKSSEAFSQIKIKAAQEISSREAALEALKKEKAELEERVKNAAPPESVKELEELRQWRAKLDLEASPKFAEFDKNVSSRQEFIYAQLKKHAVITEDIIAQIKKHGGPDMVNMDKIFEAVKDPATQRIVESQLAEIEMAKHNKQQAIDETKKNITGYIDEQRKANQASVTAHNEATKTHFDVFLQKLPWLKDQTVDEKADKSTKEAAKAHNDFVATTKKQLDSALLDDTPEMRAVMLTGMAQLLYLQRVHEATKAELENYKKQLGEAKETLSKVKTSGARLRESGAAPGVTKVAPKASDMFHKSAAEALDDIAKQVMEERARAAGTSA